MVWLLEYVPASFQNEGNNSQLRIALCSTSIDHILIACPIARRVCTSADPARWSVSRTLGAVFFLVVSLVLATDVLPSTLHHLCSRFRLYIGLRGVATGMASC